MLLDDVLEIAKALREMRKEAQGEWDGHAWAIENNNVEYQRSCVKKYRRAHAAISAYLDCLHIITKGAYNRHMAEMLPAMEIITVEALVEPTGSQALPHRHTGPSS